MLQSALGSHADDEICIPQFYEQRYFINYFGGYYVHQVFLNDNVELDAKTYIDLTNLDVDKKLGPIRGDIYLEFPITLLL